MNKPTVGQELYIVDAGNRARHRVEHRPCVVVKVGRKYFDVEYSEGRYKTSVTFTIDTYRQKTECSENFVLYENKESYLESIEIRKWIQVFAKEFKYWSRSFSVTQLREVGKILGIELEK